MRIEFDIPEDVLHRLLDDVPMPDMARIRYDMNTPPALPDVPGEVRDQIARAGAYGLIRQGQRVAIGVGSRGIGDLQTIVAALVAQIRALGADPFIIPTMGSHGGATADGQREVLRHLGITADSVCAPIEAQMDTVEVGRTPKVYLCASIGWRWRPTASSLWDESSHTPRFEAAMRAVSPR